jgi:hypothetical protein
MSIFNSWCNKSCVVLAILFSLSWNTSAASADDQLTAHLMTMGLLAWEYYDLQQSFTETEESIQTQQHPPTTDDVAAMKATLDGHQTSFGGLHIFPSANQAIESASSQSNDEAYSLNLADMPDSDGACQLTLLPTPAYTGDTIAAWVEVPEGSGIDAISCRVPGKSIEFIVPVESGTNVFFNLDAFNLPLDYTLSNLTAVCFVFKGGDYFCSSQDTVVVDQTGSCASLGFAGPETVVRDGKEWQRCVDEHQHYTVPGAEAHCRDLVLHGHDDWRWPTKAELKSLVYCSNGRETPLPDWPDVVPRPVTWDQASCCNEFDANGHCTVFPADWDEPTLSAEFEGGDDDFYTSEMFPENDTSGEDEWWIVEFWADGVAYPSYIPNLDEPDTGYNVRCVRDVSE